MKSTANVVATDTLRVVAPGDGVAIARADFTVLIDESDSQRAHAVWRAIGAEHSVDSVIDVLAKNGLRSMPGVVIACREDSQLRIIVRGSVLAEVTTQTEGSVPSGSDAQLFDGTTIRSWTETTVDEWLTCRLYLPSSAPSGLTAGNAPASTTFLLSGIAAAGAVVWDRLADADANAAAAGEVVHKADEPREKLVVTGAGNLPTVANVEVEVSENPTTAAGAVTVSDVAVEQTAGTPSTGPDQAGLDQAGTDQASPDQAGPEHDGGTAAGRSLAPNETRSLSDFSDRQPSTSTSTPTSAPTPVLAEPTDQSAPSESAALTPQGDHDGHTISVTELRRRRSDSQGEQFLPPSVHTSGPTVQAVLCSAGHPNPVYADRCRRCSQDVAGDIVVVTRPSLGRIRASSGEVVELNRPVIVGRNPSLTGRRVSEIPHEWRIAVAGGLSRSHAMFHIDGWQVRVEDLGSINSTTVTLPGRVPEMLRAGEPVLITNGTVIDLGGEVTCTYDATP